MKHIRIFIIIVIINIACIAPIIQGCPSGFVIYAGYCFKQVALSNAIQNGIVECNKYNYDLSTIDETLAIKAAGFVAYGMLAVNGFNSYGDVGPTSKTGWRTSNGTLLNLENAVWLNGFPSNVGTDEVLAMSGTSLRTYPPGTSVVYASICIFREKKYSKIIEKVQVSEMSQIQTTRFGNPFVVMTTDYSDCLSRCLNLMPRCKKVYYEETTNKCVHNMDMAQRLHTSYNFTGAQWYEGVFNDV